MLNIIIPYTCATLELTFGDVKFVKFIQLVVSTLLKEIFKLDHFPMHELKIFFLKTASYRLLIFQNSDEF